MTTLDQNELAVLSTAAGGSRASLYMPTIKAGQETQQNPIRFKNLYRELRRQLEQSGEDAEAIERLLQPAAPLLDDFDFWQHTERGLALFLGPDFYRYYHLPIDVDELAMCGERFYLKPLLRLFGQDRQFYVLALSKNSVRLLLADPHGASELTLDDEVPTSLTEALGEELTEQRLQFHSGDAGGQPIYHAQGGGDDDVKPELQKFFSLLDKGVCARIGVDNNNKPLLLAGVEYLHALYREVSDYKHIVEDGVSGNVEHLSDEQLKDKAWALLAPRFASELEQLGGRFQAALAEGRASGDLGEVLGAALDGRVDTLMLARGERRWGRYDSNTRALQRHPERSADSEELLDLAAVQTYTHGGRVVVCDPERVPDDGAAAIFRY